MPGNESPLVLFIHGSGCAPPFWSVDSGKPNVTFLPPTPYAKQDGFALIAVDKPYQPLRPTAATSGAEVCPRQFNNFFRMTVG